MTDLSDLKALKLRVANIKNQMRDMYKRGVWLGMQERNLKIKLKLAQVKYRKLYMKIYSKNYYKSSPEAVIRAVKKYKKTPKGIRSRKKYQRSDKNKERMKRYEQSEKGLKRQKTYRERRKQ